jgi:DNA-binding CsgD family transcriptional regulator
LAHLGEARMAALHTTGLTLTLEEAVARAAQVVVPDHRRHAVLGPSMLTPREREVLRLMAGMHTDQDIADALSLSRRTVSGHVTHILDKLDVTTRRAAVRRGHALGILAAPES